MPTLLTTYLLALAASALLLAFPAAAEDSCQVVGEVFAPSPFENAVTIKEDNSEDIATVQFSSLTRFNRLAVDGAPAGTFDPKTFRAGDRVCVPPAPAPILVIRRLDIQEQQKRVLSELIRNSVFGTVTDVDPKKQTIQLNESPAGGASRDVTVDAGDPVAFRRFEPATQGSANAVPSSWGNVRVGDSLYVEGRFDTDTHTLRAGVVIVGDVQAIAGTIVAINGLGFIDLDDLRSGIRMTIELPRDVVFRTAPFDEEAPAKEQSPTLAYWNLRAIGLADLQTGDTIAVLVKAGQNLHKLTGLMAVTGFASFRTAKPSGAAPLFWLIDPLQQAR